ncbi:MAG: oligopeptide transporter, OPT family [Planctomycetota bacterium]|nr:MAG: oligopeptide transporter, OPT family [Planctomycetota bacterium]
MSRNFRPYVAAEEDIREFTPLGVLTGVFLGALFAAANAYVGLKVGLTVSASIPVAVVSMAILRMARGTVLENNMAQTVGSAGESLVAGLVFTLPALYLWGQAPSFADVALTTVLGGVLGVLFMIPLRRFLIVQEHGRLPYPEGTACAEVLKAGQEGGGAAARVFAGLGLGAAYALAFKVFGFLLERVAFTLRIGGVYRANLSLSSIPSLLGVGYILGLPVAGMMMAGATLGWLVFMPTLHWVGTQFDGVLPPAESPLGELNSGALWSHYIRYIGAGAVTLGGLLSLFRTLLRFFQTLAKSWNGSSSGEDSKTRRTSRELPYPIALFLGLLCVLALRFLGVVDSLWAALAVVTFSGIFVAVSAQIVGLVGVSSNPVSGMTVTTLLGTALLLSAHGYAGLAGMVQTISVGAVVCIAACMAGDTSQDLKTGYLLGATPRRQQIGELIGTVSAALVLSFLLPFILTLPDPAGGTALLNVQGASEGVATVAEPDFQAPQANIMKTLVEGIFEQDLPWVLLFIGMAVAVVVELLGVPSLPFAVGLYLPFSLSASIFCGGLLRWLAERFRGRKAAEKGILAASGLIAGEALIGIGMIAAIWATSMPAVQGWFGVANLSGFQVPDRGNWAIFATLLAFPAVALFLLLTTFGSSSEGRQGDTET